MSGGKSTVNGKSTVDKGGRRSFSADFLTELFSNPLDPGYAEAARRLADGPAPAAWRVGAGRASRVLVLALVGFLLTVAYLDVVAAQPATSSARERLVDDVRARRTQTDDMQRRADQLRADVARARDEALSDSGEAAQLAGLAAMTGLAAVQGDGVVVKVADAPPPVDPVTGKLAANNPGIVLDRDLQDIANELWRHGAEAVAINDQRLTATSTIRAAGSTILVDFRPVSSPYRVAAIGPDDLDQRFTDSVTGRRFRRYCETYHMQLSVDDQHLALPAAPDPQLRHARPPGPAPSAGGGGGTSPGRPGTGGPSQPGATPVRSASGGVR